MDEVLLAQCLQWELADCIRASSGEQGWVCPDLRSTMRICISLLGSECIRTVLGGFLQIGSFTFGDLSPLRCWEEGRGQQPIAVTSLSWNLPHVCSEPGRLCWALGHTCESGLNNGYFWSSLSLHVPNFNKILSKLSDLRWMFFVVQEYHFCVRMFWWILKFHIEL